MADYKTAEQYVVEKLEEVEQDLKDTKLLHDREMTEVRHELDRTRGELDDAYTLLNMFRDFIDVRRDSHSGIFIFVDEIYANEHPEEVALLMEYFDLRPEDNDDE
jgi:hypothetical protein